MEKMVLMEFADAFRMKNIPYKLSKIFQIILIIVLMGLILLFFNWNRKAVTSPAIVFIIVAASGIIEGEQPKVFFMLPGSISKYMRAKVKVLTILEEIAVVFSLFFHLIVSNYTDEINTFVLVKDMSMAEGVVEILILFLFHTTNIFFINSTMLYFNYTVKGKLENSMVKKIIVYITYIWTVAILLAIDHVIADILFIMFSASVIVISICIINNVKNKLKMINHWIAKEEVGK